MKRIDFVPKNHFQFSRQNQWNRLEAPKFTTVKNHTSIVFHTNVRPKINGLCVTVAKITQIIWSKKGEMFVLQQLIVIPIHFCLANDSLDSCTEFFQQKSSPSFLINSTTFVENKPNPMTIDDEQIKTLKHSIRYRPLTSNPIAN